MRKFAIIVAFALLCVPLISAVLPTQLSMTNCQLSAPSYTCGSNIQVSCNIATQSNASQSPKVVSATYVVSGISTIASLTSGTTSSGVWTGTIPGSSKYLTSTLTLDSVSATDSSAVSCTGSSTVTTDKCYISFGNQTAATNSCTCTYARSEGACQLDNTQVVTLTPSAGCSVTTPTTMTVSCDYCNPGFYPIYGACSANVSTSNKELQGIASVTWQPSDGGQCCTQTGLDSDCKMPLSAPTGACYLEGPITTQTGASYSNNNLNSGFRQQADFSLDTSLYGSTTNGDGLILEPITWDFNGDTVNDVVVFTNKSLVMMSGQDHNVEATIDFDTGYIPRQPALMGVFVSPAGTKYIDPRVTKANPPKIVVPLENAQTGASKINVYTYNTTTNGWVKTATLNMGMTISGVGCYNDVCYALTEDNAETQVSLVQISNMFSNSLTFGIPSYAGTGTPVVLKYTVPTVVQRSTMYDGQPTILFPFVGLGTRTAYLFWNRLHVDGSAYGETNSMTMYLLPITESFGVSRLRGPIAFDYSTGIGYQSYEYEASTGKLYLGYFYSTLCTTGNTDCGQTYNLLDFHLNILWQNNRTAGYGDHASGLEGISPVVIQKPGVAAVLVSTASASSTYVVGGGPAPPVVNLPVSLPSPYKNFRKSESTRYYVNDYVVDPTHNFMYSAEIGWVDGAGVTSPSNPELPYTSDNAVWFYSYGSTSSLVRTNIASGVKTTIYSYKASQAGTGGAISGQSLTGLTYNPSEKVLHTYNLNAGYWGITDRPFDVTDFAAPVTLPSTSLSADVYTGAPYAPYFLMHNYGAYYPNWGIISLGAGSNFAGHTESADTQSTELFPSYWLYTHSANTGALYYQIAGNNYDTGYSYYTNHGGPGYNTFSNVIPNSITYGQGATNAGEIYTKSIAYNPTADVLITEGKIFVGCKGGCTKIISMPYKLKAFNFDWTTPKYVNSIGQVIKIDISGGWNNAFLQTTGAECNPAGGYGWFPLFYHSDKYILGLNADGPVQQLSSESSILPVGGNGTGVSWTHNAVNYLTPHRLEFTYCDVTDPNNVVVSGTGQYIDSLNYGRYTQFGKTYEAIIPKVVELDGNLDGSGTTWLMINQEISDLFSFSHNIIGTLIYNMDTTRSPSTPDQVAPPPVVLSNASSKLYAISAGTTIVNTITKPFRPTPLGLGVAQMGGTSDNDIVVPGGWFDVSAGKFYNTTIGYDTAAKELVAALGLNTDTYTDVLVLSPGLNSAFFHMSTPVPSPVSIGASLEVSAVQCTVKPSSSSSQNVEVSIAASATNPAATSVSILPGDNQQSIAEGKLSTKSTYSVQYSTSGQYTLTIKLVDDANPSNVATGSCNVAIDVLQNTNVNGTGTTNTCAIGADGLFEYTDSVTNHGWTTDSIGTISGSDLKPAGGYFKVTPDFSIQYNIPACNYQVFNVVGSFYKSENYQSIVLTDDTGAMVSSMRFDATTSKVYDENSNVLGTWDPNSGSSVLVQIKVDRYNGIITKYVNGVQVKADQNKQFVVRSIRLEQGGLWDYVSTYAEGDPISVVPESALLCGTQSILSGCNGAQLQASNDVNVRRGYANVGEYCGTVGSSKGVLCTAVPEGQCDMQELQKIVSYNPECTKEAFNYCVGVIQNVNAGRAPGANGGDVRGATSCTVLLTVGAVTGNVVGPTLLDGWSYFTGNPLLLGIIIVVVLISIAIAAVRRRF